MNFKIKKIIINGNIIHLNFKTQYELTSTLMRLQEFYESPYSNIRGKYFTLEEFMDAYSRDFGNFTYTSDWSGFNIPGNIVSTFFFKFWSKHNDLLNKENQLYNLLYNNIYYNKSNPFYLIATHSEDKEYEITLKHEISHALYNLDSNYKKEMTELLNKYDFDVLYQNLINMGYNINVLEDEAIAYLSTGLHEYYMIEKYTGIVPLFRNKFNKYYNPNRTKLSKTKLSCQNPKSSAKLII